MKRKSLTQYFYNGFSLTNQSFDILFIAILLLIPSLVSVYVKNTILISFIFVLISLVFTLSVPVFLVYKQQKKVFSYKEVFSVVIRNTKRMILPVIVYFLLFGAFFIISSAIFINQVKAFAQGPPVNLGKGWHAILLIPIFVLSFFEFTSFFFSLEHNGLFTSMKKSLLAAFKSLSYIALVILFGVVTYSIISFIPIETFWGYLLRIVLGQYCSLVLLASSLFYYQDVIDVIKEDQFIKTSRGRPVNRRP